MLLPPEDDAPSLLRPIIPAARCAHGKCEYVGQESVGAAVRAARYGRG